MIKKQNSNIPALLLRNLLFTILKPGIVIGLIPFMIMRYAVDEIIQQIGYHHYVGVILFLVGLTIMLNCIIKFAIEGRGTLSPIDPTKSLVVSGLYRFSRNPMYIGAITMLVGEAIFTQAVYLWIYSLIVFLIFNLILLLIEEPRLIKDFDKEYKQYRQNVRRWI